MDLSRRHRICPCSEWTRTTSQWIHVTFHAFSTRNTSQGMQIIHGVGQGAVRGMATKGRMCEAPSPTVNRWKFTFESFVTS